MSTTSDDGVIRTDDAVEVLLEQASPRPVPPSADERMIRAAVQAKWQAVTSRHRAHTRITRFAVAATVLMAVTVSFYLLREAGIAPVQVATIGKSHGSILLGNPSQLHDLSDFTAIVAGQTIVTDTDSGIGLAWGNGGSLRIAADTRIEFISAEEVFLRSGKIYFDSTPSGLIANISGSSKEPEFRIQTSHGIVTHRGTQYMTMTGSNALLVMVREGEVIIEGNYRDEIAREGQQLEIVGSAPAHIMNFPRHGAAWDWIEATSPVADVDGRSVDEFLHWVSRETGLKISYESPQAKQAAQEEKLIGKMELGPRAALDFWLPGQEMNWHIDGGTIIVSLK